VGGKKKGHARGKLGEVRLRKTEKGEKSSTEKVQKSTRGTKKKRALGMCRATESVNDNVAEDKISNKQGWKQKSPRPRKGLGEGGGYGRNGKSGFGRGVRPRVGGGFIER